MERTKGYTLAKKTKQNWKNESERFFWMEMISSWSTIIWNLEILPASFIHLLWKKLNGIWIWNITRNYAYLEIKIATYPSPESGHPITISDTFYG